MTIERSLSRRIAEDTAAHVLSETTRAAIEKMAEEYAREMLQDDEFRMQLREEAREAARKVAASLRANGTKSKRPRKRRAT
jgi:hypothetical protein